MERMKAVNVLTIILVVVGSTLSYFGYQQSLQPLPTTQTYTITSQQLTASVSLTVITSTNTDAIIGDLVYLNRWESPSWIGCGYHIRYTRTLHAGSLYVSYSAVKTGQSTYHPQIDFFLMRPAAKTEYVIQPTVCGAGISYGRDVVFSALSMREYGGMVKVPETGEYDFEFFVQQGMETGASWFSIRVEQTVTTVTTLDRTFTTSADIPYETSNTTLRFSGLTSSFYFGFIVLLIAGVISVVSAFFVSRKPRARSLVPHHKSLSLE